MESIPLQGEAALATAADWEREAAAVLKKSGKLTDADAANLVWDKLAKSTLDGISVTPLGTPASAAGANPTRPTRAQAWDVRAWFADSDPAKTAKEIITDLENGVNSIWLRVGSGGIAANQIWTALADVLVDVAPVMLDAPDDFEAAATAYITALTGRKPAPTSTVGADPISVAVRRKEEVPIAKLQQLIKVAHNAQAAGIGAITVDGTAIHDIGANDTQELGYVLALGVHYLRTLTEAGFTTEQAQQLISFRLAATADQFTTIAKFRAFRRCWAQVQASCGLAGEVTLHAVTSRPMMSKYDPWVNMLRTTVAAFAAGVGGADVVTVLPFDLPIGLADDFSRRNARNTSALLLDEAHVAAVADPAGGAYAIEQLTEDISQQAWAEFQGLEELGGVVAAYHAGIIFDAVDEVVALRKQQIATRKRPITGLTEFPNLTEELPVRQPYAAGFTTVSRYGEDFELLRAEPSPSAVFLATLGKVSEHTARATFAANLFAAGGITTVNPGEQLDTAAVLAGYQAAGKPAVVCLVGTDKAYAAWGADVVQTLRTAGASWVIVAGKTELAADDSCAIGVDALAFLNRTREKLK